MIIGAYNQLVVDRFTPPGAYLLDDQGNDVLLPTKYIPGNCKKGDELEVFVYLDSEDRPVATTLSPFLTVGDFACLKVKQVNRFGAFMDWGIEKDLMVPFREQIGKMVEGNSYIIYLYLDEKTQRLVGTQKIQPYLETEEIQLSEGEEVDLLIADSTSLGVNVIINNRYKGLIFESELFKDLLIGDKSKGYVKQVRPDKKIDVSLRPSGIENLELGASKIISLLEQEDGFLPLTDKSDPTEIQFHLEMSKKNFKRSLGILYKKRLVVIEEKGIRKL